MVKIACLAYHKDAHQKEKPSGQIFQKTRFINQARKK